MVMDEEPKPPEVAKPGSLREKIRQILPPYAFEELLRWHWTSKAGVWSLEVTQSSAPRLVFKGRILEWKGDNTIEEQLKDFVRVAIAVRALTPPITHS